ncbi:PAS domain-containing sensor histidine kinase [Exiguobacterium sp. KRL4]|uniref:two-component system histidine kinase PnpS n=1 Tax=Exiguobacterium sp. KRL4 TaxID=1914536 RepID=UPI0008F87CE4|nr:HAMP domain-containing sensor histidine kinase [Exiguobacterium sp. KRL4]OIN66497.1 PAS domain-containing sensor histidine kinase [Exiguobacterium sp. KRL4]
MSKYRKRFILKMLSFISLVLVALGFLLGQSFKEFYVNNEKEKLTDETVLVETILRDRTVPEMAAYVDKLYAESNFDMILFNGRGEIIAGTPVDVTKLNVRAINFSAIPGEGTFESKTDETSLQYTKPVMTADGSEVYISFIRYTKDLNLIYSRIWTVIILSLLASLSVIFFSVYRATKRFLRPIAEATEVLYELSHGNYKSRVYELTSPDESRDLGKSINLLARNLENASSGEAMQRARLESLIEYMGAGLMLIDEKGYVLLVNRTYREMFNIHDKSNGQLYYRVLPNEKMSQVIEDVYLTEKPNRKQSSVRFGLNSRTFMVSAAPIFGKNGRVQGTTVVFNDITEIKKLEQMRKDFVANVSHELKTPLTSIKGFAETLLDGAQDVPEIREQFLNIIHDESERMQTLVEDLLELSRLEQDNYQLETAIVDVTSLLRETETLLRHKAAEKQMTIHLETEEEVFIRADLNRLKQVVVNLVANALNYTPNGGNVWISLEDGEETVMLRIKDDGIGIHPKETQRIFERFYRVDKARSRNSGGTGLGLAIVKHIIDLHHGTIDVESEENEGTTFTIRLPKKG